MCMYPLHMNPLPKTNPLFEVVQTLYTLGPNWPTYISNFS